MNRYHQQLREGFDLQDQIDPEKRYIFQNDRWEESPDGQLGIEVWLQIEEELQQVLDEWQQVGVGVGVA